MPARILGAIGEIGPGADAINVERMDLGDDYLQGIFANPNDLPRLLVQRYYKLSRPSDDARVLMHLRNADPLIVTKLFGSGKVVLCATTASPKWANLPVGGGPLFLPMLERICLGGARQSQLPAMYECGSGVSIAVGPGADEIASHPAQLPLAVSREGDKTTPVQMQAAWSDKEGFLAMFTKADQPGIYRWQASPGDQVKVKSADGGAAAPVPTAFLARLPSTPSAANATWKRSRPRPSRTVWLTWAWNTSTSATRSPPPPPRPKSAQGHNWWDLLLAIAIVLLVAEAMVANRRKVEAEAVPAHLNPKLAKN